MTRRPSLIEVLFGGVVASLIVFVASQVIASPRTFGATAERTLSGRDSASIAAQYRSQVGERRGSYDVPAWLAQVQIARLHAAAIREINGRDSIARLSPDSIRALLDLADRGTYLRRMLDEDGGLVTRWHERVEPIGVWIQPQSSEAGFSTELIGPTRRAFSVWNEVALGVSFAMIDDSTAADVHVTWSAAMPKAQQLGTTFRMTGGTGWIAFAHVVLSTSYDIYTVQNAARHEAGHVLGLGHSPEMRDIMAVSTEGRQVHLTDADRATAAWLYRLPPGAVGSRE